MNDVKEKVFVTVSKFDNAEGIADYAERRLAKHKYITDQIQRIDCSIVKGGEKGTENFHVLLQVKVRGQADMVFKHDGNDLYGIIDLVSHKFSEAFEKAHSS